MYMHGRELLKKKTQFLIYILYKENRVEPVSG